MTWVVSWLIVETLERAPAPLSGIPLISRKYTPMGDELKWLLREGGGRIFESCYISLENMPTSHTVTLLFAHAVILGIIHVLIIQ